MRLRGDGPNPAFTNDMNTLGIVAVDSPHNEKPIGTYSTELLRELVDELEEREVKQTTLWTTNHTDKPPLLVSTTTDENPALGFAIAPLLGDSE